MSPAPYPAPDASVIPDPSPGDRAEIGRLVAIMGLSAFASTVSMRLLDPLVPMIADAMARSVVEIALLSSIFTLSYALGQPFLGPVADALGKSRVISACLAMLAITNIAAVLAPDYVSLGVARALSGVFAGGVIPVAMAAIGDRVEMSQRQVALSRFLAALTIGQVAGSTLSGIIATSFGWRNSFLFAAGIATLGSIMVAVLVKPRAGQVRQSLDIGVALRRYRDVLANPKALPLFALVIGEGMSVFGIFPYIADIVHDRGAQTAAEAGLVIAPFGAGGLFYAACAPWLVRRIGPRMMTLCGGVVMLVTLALFALPLDWRVAPVLFGFNGFGFYLLHTSFQTQATELSSTARGSAVALFACCLFLGTAMGPPVMGAMIHGLGLAPALIITGLFALMIGGLAGPVLNLPRASAKGH